jgi:hypothetical protein
VIASLRGPETAAEWVSCSSISMPIQLVSANLSAVKQCIRMVVRASCQCLTAQTALWFDVVEGWCSLLLHHFRGRNIPIKPA